jgi:hypothetical protein
VADSFMRGGVCETNAAGNFPRDLKLLAR